MEALHGGEITLSDRVRISKIASQTTGNRMSLRAGEGVSVETLIRGMLIASANDAAVALAEHICGDVPKFVERMNRQLNSLEILVNKFRSFSKSQEAATDIYNINDIIAENADGFPEILTVIVGNKEVSAILDRNFMSQILLNLYKNSINAGAKHIGVKIIEEKTSVKVEIKDDGKGIEKEKLDKIFLPYTTYTNGGSGIGLSVVKNLCEKMGAVCYAESAVNVGFTMTIILKKG
jgi:signal transduction histidine kinase